MKKVLPRSTLTRRGFLLGSGLLAGPLPAAAAGPMGAGGQVSRPGPGDDALPSLQPRIVPLPPEEYQARQEKARKLMTAARLDALLLMGGSSLNYFTGVAWGRSERVFAAVLPRRGQPAYICPAFERKRAEEQIRFGKDLRTWEEHESPYRLLLQALRDRQARRLGLEETIPYFVAAGLGREAPAIALAPADSVTAGCRMVKSPREVALMELASEATSNAIGAAFGRLREGMTPRQLSEAVSSAHAQQGARPGFASVGFGPASAFPHGSTRPQKLREGDVVLVDAGCTIEGYQSDITRTTVLGKPSDRQRRVWDAVKKAQTAVLEAARPGVAAETLDAVARRVLDEAGWGPDYKFLTHRLGHGIGLDGHEWPYLVRGNKLPLAPGMTFSDEPGVYLYGEFGVRLEDVMVITETGARLLTLQTQSLAQSLEHT